jgi:hypothetical protein
MTHPTEQTLNDFLDRALSPAEHVEVADHVERCGDCALIVAELQYVVREAAALGPVTPPAHVWERLRERLEVERSMPGAREKGQRVNVSRFSWALATAALIVLAFLTGRYVDRRGHEEGAPPQAGVETAQTTERPADVRERVLVIAVGDHLERSQMVLVELANAGPRADQGPVADAAWDLSAEQEWADELLASNRLYRQTAVSIGQDNVAEVLDELERVLVEVARGPSQVSMQQLAALQQRIEAQGILFKVKVIGSDMRERGSSLPADSNPPVL